MVSTLLILLYLTFPVLLLLFFHKYRTTNNPPRPPGPRGLPIIGNLHQLNSSTLHLKLWQLISKIYGPLFALQLGFRPAVVVSSPKLAKEVLKNHGLVFSGRPALLGQQKLSYNGQYEVKQMMKKISRHASSSVVTNLSELLISLSSTIICRIAFGRRYEDEGTEKSRFHELLNECQAMLGTFFVSDYIPFMGWIDKLTGLHARLERTFKEMDKFYQEVIDEHMDPNREHREEEVIVDVLLQLKKRRSFSIDLTYDRIKAILTNMLVAATDTTAATSVWAMTALIKNPRVMKKAQEEIRKFENKKDFLDENDIEKFPYLKSVIKETLRLHLPTPLLVPREANEKCTVDGYQIQAKTIVYVNAWAIHRDLEAWKDPEEFYPGRFLDSAIDFHGQDFELIPFGAGRRICPWQFQHWNLFLLIFFIPLIGNCHKVW